MNLLEWSVWVFAMLFLWLFVERRCNQLESIFYEWRREKEARISDLAQSLRTREGVIQELDDELAEQERRFKSRLRDILDDKEDDK